MPIQVGDKMPEGNFRNYGRFRSRRILSTDELFAGKKSGAGFCTRRVYANLFCELILPGFVVNSDKLHARGIDTIACMAVNDVHVMHAWGQAQIAENITMLADVNDGVFVRALGLEVTILAPAAWDFGGDKVHSLLS